MKKKVSNFIKKHDSLLLIISTILIELILFFLNIKNNYMEIIVGLFTLIMGIMYVIYRKTKNKKYIFYMIYFLGLLIRTIYIFKTNIYTRQHDVDSLVGTGHLKYIYKIYSTGRLPETNTWQFYHPPLWHLIGAGWLKFNDLFGTDLNVALEGIQIWSLLFSAGLIIITDKIFEKLKINNHWHYLGDLIIASHPSLIIFSGSINNDCLLVFLQALIILELIIWYRDSSYKNIVILAITTGLCVMTKANGAIMAIPILYVFIKKFIILYKEKKISKKFFYQMGLFLIIALPIGLWFQVRNMILFDTVKIPTPNERLSLREIPLIKRLLDFNIMNLFRFVDFENDYNIFILILKTTVFGEFSYNDMLFIIPMLLVTNILLIIIGLFYIISYIFKKKDLIVNILFITWITSLIMEIIFNIKYPYICTANFRYIVISLLPGIIIPIFMLKDKGDSIICDFFATLSITLVMTSAIFIILM